MAKTLQHGAASKSPKRSLEPADDDKETTINIPAELVYLPDSQRKLSENI